MDMTAFLCLGGRIHSSLCLADYLHSSAGFPLDLKERPPGLDRLLMGVMCVVRGSEALQQLALKKLTYGCHVSELYN